MRTVSILTIVCSQLAFAQIGIGTVDPNPSAILEVRSTEKGVLLPRLTQTQKEAIVNPSEGLMIYNTTTSCLEVFNSVGWNNLCGTGITPIPPDVTLPLPSGMTITNLDQTKYVASIYDNDYLPFTLPTVGSNADTSQVDADGNVDPLIDIQGVIGVDGSNDTIPVVFNYTATNSGIAYDSLLISKTVHDSLIENSTSPIKIVLEYPSGTTTGTSGSIIGKIYAQTTLNAKKLDLNSGLGEHLQGILMADFNSIPINSSGGVGSLKLYDITGVPDLNFGSQSVDGTPNEHDFIYIPIEGEDGNVWLNNNLGAHYANVHHSGFNPGQQALSKGDTLAFGSKFQWGRGADGHELSYYTSLTTGEGVKTYINGSSSNALPNHSYWYRGEPAGGSNSLSWTTGITSNKWNSASAENNPCPEGFRIPSRTEWLAYITAVGTMSNSTAAHLTNLKISAAGLKHATNNSMVSMDNYAMYACGNQQDQTYGYYFRVGNGEAANVQGYYKSYGYTVRCMKD